MKARWTKTKHPRVFVRHEEGCPAYEDRRCRCAPKFRAEVWNPETKRPDKQSPAVSRIDEAIGWAADRKRGIENPEPKTTNGVTVDEFMATFFAAARSGAAMKKGGKNYSPRTLDVYERDYRHHVQPHAGPKAIDAMDARAWQIVVENIMATGQIGRDGLPSGLPLAAASINSTMAVVRAAYRYGASPARRLVASNPMRDVEIPNGKKPARKRVAAPETIPTLLAAMTGRKGKHGDHPNPAARVAWGVMFYGGLRISEVVALDWADVDLKAAWITVGDSKTEAGTYRRVPIVPELDAILRDWQGGTFRIGPLLPGRRGVRIGARTIASQAETAWTLAGLPVYSPHEARHTFASVMVSNRDVSLSELQEWLGHASLTTTAIYVKTLPGFRQESTHARVARSFGA